MKFTQIFKASLYEFKKLAAFRLLPIGKVFSYVFLFVFLFTLISFTRFLTGDATLFEETSDLQAHSEKIGALIYPMAFMLQLVISTFYIFIRISVFTFIGMFALKLLKKRGQYLQMWRTTAIAMTIPILITIALDFYPAFELYGLIFTSILHIIYIILASRYYPKAPPARPSK